jgi:glutamyl-Q tRNA(Asp) synthetase
LHLGSLAAALASYLFAKSQHGQWLIRVEDLDPPREIAGMAAQQLATLAEFGLHSDEPVWFQSKRGETYQRALQRLLDEGSAFYCSCSRTQLAASQGIHRVCLAAADPARAAIRLRVNAEPVIFTDAVYGRQCQNLQAEVGDVVLKRADGYFAYQLAVVLDDAAQGINQVVRGADLLDSTPRQIFLQARLGLSTPHYAHIGLVRDGHGDKLSKSQWAASLAEEDRFQAFCAAYAHLGQNTAVLSRTRSMADNLAQAVLHFKAERVTRSTARAPA